MIFSFMKNIYAHSHLDSKMEFTGCASKNFIFKIESHESKKKIINKIK